MTIKQYGGVFGRNPTFNDVTIEGTLTFDGDIDINSDLKVDGNLEVTGTSFLDGHVGIGVDPAVTGLHLQGTDNVSSSFTITNTANSNTWKFQPQYNALQLRIFGQGSEVAQFDASNNFNLIGGGNLVVNSGNGIDFSATAQAPGSTSELLDDYEEGTFTPTYVGSTTSGDHAYTTQAGFYEKIGRLVNFRIRLTTTAKGTIAGNITIAGLPFTSASTANSYGGAYSVNGAGLSITAGTNVNGYVNLNAATISLQVWSATTGTTSFTDANMTNTTQLWISGSYSTA